MSQDLAERLGSLARDHREGRLSLRAYRDLRAPLLDLLVTRQSVDVDTTRPRMTSRPVAAEAVVAAVQSATSVGLNAPDGRAHNRRAARSGVLGAVVVLVGAGAVFVAWALNWSPLHFLPNANTPQPRAEVTRDFVRTFLEDDDWSDERLRALNVRLGDGTDTATPITRTQWGRRLADAVRARLKERQALGAKLLDHSDNPLADLAVRVGIDFESLDELSTVPEQAVEVVAKYQPVAVADANPATCPASGPGPGPGASARNLPCQDKLASGESGPKLAVVPAEPGKTGEPRDPPQAGAGANAGSIAAGAAPTTHRAFGVSIRQVSQSQFRLFCERTSHTFPRQPWDEDEDPVVNVTWNEARDYLAWLSTASGQQYRLPTETEWSRAASVIGVGAKSGIGRVREWVEDTWSEDGGADNSQHVVRGMSYADREDTPQTARRGRTAETRDALTGFRALREIT
ncbi:MAG: SUMF1/EgtB/PvdO family nonheme iron enzyme [Gammaproteobacteria bacterium]